MEPTAERLKELKQAIQTHCISILPEPVQLNSGGWSNYYCDSKLVTLHPYYARLVGAFLAPIVLASGAEAIGGLATGSIPISDAVGAAALDLGHTLPTFFGRSAAKDHGPEAKATISQSAPLDDGPVVRPGRRVAILEDAVTQGGAAMQAVRLAREAGCDVVLVACIVERHEGGGARFRESGLPFRRLFYTTEDGALHVDADLGTAFGG